MKSVQSLAVLCLALVACGPTATTPETTTTDAGLPTTTAPALETTTTSVPESELLEILLEDGAPIDGVVRIEVEVGDMVEFRITSDHDDELHVHGFDHYIDLPANETVEVSFVAEAPGIFEIESHRRHRLVAELVVQ